MIPILATFHGGSVPPATLNAALAAALLVSVVLAGYCIYHAIRTRSRYIPVVLCAAAFGLFVEWFDMKTFGTYKYAESWASPMVLKIVPLYIVLCWGSIIYSAMTTSDHMGLRWWLRPINDGLLALTIDLSLDPVAINLGLWTWLKSGNPAFPLTSLFNTDFLHVPLANYYGWYMLVFSFSLVVRAGFHFWPPERHGWWVSVPIALAAIPCAFFLFLASLFLYYVPVAKLSVPESAVFSVLLGVNLVAVLRFLAECPHDKPMDFVSVASPLALHGYVILVFYASGLYVEHHTAGLVILVPTIAAFSLMCFAWPYLDHVGDFLESRGSVLAPAHAATPGGPPGHTPAGPAPVASAGPALVEQRG